MTPQDCHPSSRPNLSSSGLSRGPIPHRTRWIEVTKDGARFFTGPVSKIEHGLRFRSDHGKPSIP